MAPSQPILQVPAVVQVTACALCEAGLPMSSTRGGEDQPGACATASDSGFPGLSHRGARGRPGSVAAVTVPGCSPPGLCLGSPGGQNLLGGLGGAERLPGKAEGTTWDTEAAGRPRWGAGRRGAGQVLAPGGAVYAEGRGEKGQVQACELEGGGRRGGGGGSIFKDKPRNPARHKGSQAQASVDVKQPEKANDSK